MKSADRARSTSTSPAMDHDSVVMLRRTHPAWRLLAAEHAALVASFLHETFIAPNVRSLSQQQITTPYCPKTRVHGVTPPPDGRS